MMERVSKNEKGGRGSAARSAQNYTATNIAQNEKKAREIRPVLVGQFPVTAFTRHLLN
jgi:hypothetical protein